MRMMSRKQSFMRIAFIDPEFSLPLAYPKYLRIHSSGAVTDLIPVNTELIQQSQVQIRERYVFKFRVTTTLQISSAAAGQNERNIDWSVAVAVGDACPIDQSQMIEQTAVAIRSRAKFLHQIREHLDVIGVDLCSLRDLFRLFLVMRNGMVRVGDA